MKKANLESAAERSNLTKGGGGVRERSGRKTKLERPGQDVRKLDERDG